jgi:hypothetical protein
MGWGRGEFGIPEGFFGREDGNRSEQKRAKEAKAREWSVCEKGADRKIEDRKMKAQAIVGDLRSAGAARSGDRPQRSGRPGLPGCGRGRQTAHRLPARMSTSTLK